VEFAKHVTLEGRCTASRKGNKKHRASLRRNPRPKLSIPSVAEITEAVVPAAIGGAGALALSIGIGQLAMIPVEWRTGSRGLLLRGAAALALGAVARMFLPQFRKIVDQATAGALTVTAYEGARSFVAQQWPELTLGMYDGDLSAYESVNWNALPVLQGGGVGAYVSAGAGSDLGMIPAVR
jgi:hypothetical protein